MNHESEPRKPLDLREHGALIDGKPQVSDHRLYAQVQVYTGVADPDGVIVVLAAAGVDSVLFADVNDPCGIGMLFLSDTPDVFVTEVRNLLQAAPFDKMERRPGFTMLGRSYASGYEPDLEEALIGRPRRTAMNPDWPWTILYPLRRNGDFARLDHKEQGKILMEHAIIGRSYGREDYAHDLRFACYGMDEADNDFVIGLKGKALHPLTKVIQDMRKTQQTSLYIESLGPFFVGKQIWCSDDR